MSDLDRSRNEALSELEQLYDQKDNLEQHLENLKCSLSLVCCLNENCIVSLKTQRVVCATLQSYRRPHRCDDCFTDSDSRR